MILCYSRVKELVQEQFNQVHEFTREEMKDEQVQVFFGFIDSLDFLFRSFSSCSVALPCSIRSVREYRVVQPFSRRVNEDAALQ